jgi:hypothetical protein
VLLAARHACEHVQGSSVPARPCACCHAVAHAHLLT